MGLGLLISGKACRASLTFETAPIVSDLGRRFPGLAKTITVFCIPLTPLKTGLFAFLCN